MNVDQDISSLLNKVISRLVKLQKEASPVNNVVDDVTFYNWEWPQGVGLYGLYKYYELTKSSELLKLLINWFDRQLAAGIPKRNVNTTAPMLTLAHLCEITQNANHLELCVDWARWVMQELPRTEDNGFQHVTTRSLHEQQIWADTLFMTVLFLGKMGIMLKRNDYVEEAIRQFLIHIKYLFDRETGLWFHGWTFIARNNFSKARWARGNCWFTAGVVDFIEMVNPPTGVRGYLIDTLRAQVEGLTKVQANDGMWHTLLDDPTSYGETSATAGFGYGILKGVRKGYLNKKYAVVGQRALKAAIANTLPDGSVDKVSIGTPVYNNLEQYKTVPQHPIAYGQALTMLLLGEALHELNTLQTLPNAATS